MEPTNVEKLDRKYRKRKYPPWENVETVIGFVLIILLPVVFGLLSKLIGDTLFPSQVNGEVYTLRPGDYAWFYPGMFLGWGSVGIIINQLHKIYLHRKYNQSLYFDHRFSERRIEGHKWIKPVFLTSVLLALASGYFLKDNYLGFDKNSIVINELTSIGERKYKLADISSIQYVIIRKKNVADTYYSINFRDTYQFKTRDNMFRLKEEMPVLARFCSLPIDTIFLYH